MIWDEVRSPHRAAKSLLVAIDALEEIKPCLDDELTWEVLHKLEAICDTWEGKGK
jgi:hypothetical protein